MNAFKNIFGGGDISCGLLNSLVQWIFGFTGPVDFWIHWSSEFSRFTGLNFDGRLKETATTQPPFTGPVDSLDSLVNV